MTEQERKAVIRAIEEINQFESPTAFASDEDIISVLGRLSGGKHPLLGVLSSRTLTVYHGSTTLFEMIDVSLCKPYKDFGRGFYVTENPNHAINLALRNKRIEKERYSRDVNAYLYTYKFNLIQAKTSFSVKDFVVADKIWMMFILTNRRERYRAHNHDIVIGPTADDDTSLVLKTYFDGLYGEVGTDLALETALRLIEADRLPPQIYFATNESTVCLTPKGKVKQI